MRLLLCGISGLQDTFSGSKTGKKEIPPFQINNAGADSKKQILLHFLLFLRRVKTD
jgi:hypothetical protein